MPTTKMVFHGSDIEKICEVYHLDPKNIIKFGANVNPLGLSENVKQQLASRLEYLSFARVWSSCPPILTEIILHSAIRSQSTAMSLQNLFSREMAPAN